MAFKRALFPATPVGNAKRIRRIERRQRRYRQRPELKHRDFTLTGSAQADASVAVSEFTAIAQGDGVADREGASIRVFRVEMHGHCDDSGVDLYIVSPKHNTQPAYSDFGAVPIGS